MSFLRGHSAKAALVFALVGCGFSPGPPGENASSGGSSGLTGSAGSSSTGTGILSGGGAATGAGGDVGVSGSAGSSDCGQMNVPINQLPPDILIVQDRSGSMNDNSNDMSCNGGCAAASKWAQVTAAINAVVTQTQAKVNWGLKFFADTDNVCGVGNTVAVPVAANNAAAIATAITGSTSANGGVNNGSHTPTQQAEQAGAAYLGTLTDNNPKYILLATDGLPNCTPASLNIDADNSAGAATAVANAKAAGFPTFVVGIATASDAMATQTLNTMATNGGEPQTGGATSYYNVTDTASLEAALDKIVGIVASCTISLATAPKGFTNVAISADDGSGKPIEIPQDATNGWSYGPNMTTVVLNGTSCTNLQNGTYSNFQFYYACTGQPIIIGAEIAP